MLSHFRVFKRQKYLTPFFIACLAGTLYGCSSDDETMGTEPAPEPMTELVPDPETVETTPEQPVVGEPLPNPPLTQGPTAADEPVPFDPIFHTVTDFALVRDTGPRVTSVIAPDLTEADFAAGLPAPVLSVPNSVDTSTNGAPFFEGLANVRIEAGQLLELRYVPRDPEGELPGMFPSERPPGATFDDNFDGTKSLNWQTYQADIGITEFVVTAVDPLVPEYRSAQKVLIAVDPPSDPASVPNIAPSILPIAEYTVRAGDVVSIFLIGTDRNGTTPTMELVDPPANAFLTPDERSPDWRILQATPQEAGTITIDIFTRDAADPNVTGLDQIVLNVLEPAVFERSGSRLNALAASSNITFGSAISPVFYMQADGGIYESIAASEFSVMTPESSMKWILINPLPGRYEFADMDNLVNFAKFNNMKVRGHPLVWYTTLPQWVEETEVEDRRGHMLEFITRIMERYRDDIDYWDVVNEPMAEDGGMRDSLWLEAMGEEYIDIAFRQARALDPSAVLVLNEFDIGFAGPKFDGLSRLLDRLEERDVPVDAVGFQLHVSSSFDQFDELTANMASIAARGLDIHVTELDVAIVNDDSNQTQANVYKGIVEVCLAQPRCNVLQTWGFTDRYSFLAPKTPLYFDRNLIAKPAYQALQEALGGG